MLLVVHPQIHTHIHTHTRHWMKFNEEMWEFSGCNFSEVIVGNVIVLFLRN